MLAALVLVIVALALLIGYIIGRLDGGSYVRLNSRSWQHTLEELETTQFALGRRGIKIDEVRRLARIVETHGALLDALLAEIADDAAHYQETVRRYRDNR